MSTESTTSAAASFDYRGPELAHGLHATLADLRLECPVGRSHEHGGYWVVSRHAEVVEAAQDWDTFSSQLGVSIPATTSVALAIPEHIDPPLHREYKRLINAYFTPKAVAPFEDATRRIVTELIDAFVGRGEVEFMEAFAVPLPGLAFFELALGAPPDELAHVNDAATSATDPGNPDRQASWKALDDWITAFVDRRRREEPRGDVVDAIIGGTIEDRPIRDDEVKGLILLLILGGLDTTAGALGQFLIRFCQEPEIPALLRAEPERIPDAVEELLRLDGPFVGIGRTVRHDAELGGCPMAAGEKVYLSWASANRDETEFDDPDEFRLDRASNRHLAFGAGPHRCAGSNLARLNLRIAIEELLARLDDLALAVPVEDLEFHTAFNRRPIAVPLTFTARPT